MVGNSLRAISRTNGHGVAVQVVMVELERAGRLCGGIDAEILPDMADMILGRWGNRTLNALKIAIRDGINKGKIYGKLTYPVIAEWLTDHEEAYERWNYNKHLQYTGR